MALIPCPECKKEKSNTAKTCPHCGFEEPLKYKYEPGKVLIYTTVVIILLYLLAKQ